MTFTTESVETLAEWFHETTLACAHRGDVRECAMRAAALIASDWMKRHDAEVWAEGRRHGAEDRQMYEVGDGCGPDPWDCTCPNPYRAALAEEGGDRG